MPMIEPITYSHQRPLVERTFIATLEYLTGRLTLERDYKDVLNKHRASPEKPFFDHALEKLNIDITYPLLHPYNIPTDCPLLVIANHPFGILDGLIMNHMLYQARQDYKILINEVLTKAEPMRPWLISIDDSTTAEARRKNKQAIRETKDILCNNGCISIFPAGRLARPNKWGEDCEDWNWQPLVGHLAKKTKTDKPLMILPIFFEGQNSMIFRLAALAKQFTITRSLVIYELINKRKSPISVKIGQPFLAAEVDYSNAEDVTHYLRHRTLALKELTNCPYSA
jgi:putative hemolysin